MILQTLLKDVFGFTPNQLAHMRLILDRHHLSLKMLFAKLGEPFDDERQTLLLSPADQRALLGAIENMMKELFDTATDYLISCTTEYDGFQSYLAPLLDGTIGTGITAWTHLTKGAMLDEPEDTAWWTRKGPSEEQTLRSNFSVALRPVVQLAAHRAMKHYEARLAQSTEVSVSRETRGDHQTSTSESFNLESRDSSPSPTPTHPRDIINKYCGEANQTLKELAETSGISTTTLAKVKQGKLWAKPPSYAALARAINKSVPCQAEQLHPRSPEGLPLTPHKRKQRANPAANKNG